MTAVRSLLRRSAAPLVALVVALLLLEVQGIAPSIALREFWRGSFGNLDACLATMDEWLPLSLCALGVALSFRSGQWNIGGEGQWVIGALAAVVATRWLPSPWSAVLAGTVAAGVLTAIAALLRARRGVSEILTTIMANFVVLELLDYAISGPLQESTGQFPRTDRIAESAQFSTVEFSAGHHLSAALWVPLLVAALLTILLRSTRTGLLIRACASSPKRVDQAGFKAVTIQCWALIASGALCGLAGALQVSALHPFVDRSIASGIGYRAIAVALLAGLAPGKILLSALLFAALTTGSESLQWAVDRPGLDRFAWVVQALLLFFVLLDPRSVWRSRRAGRG